MPLVERLDFAECLNQVLLSQDSGDCALARHSYTFSSPLLHVVPNESGSAASALRQQVSPVACASGVPHASGDFYNPVHPQNSACKDPRTLSAKHPAKNSDVDRFKGHTNLSTFKGHTHTHTHRVNAGA